MGIGTIFHFHICHLSSLLYDEYQESPLLYFGGCFA